MSWTRCSRCDELHPVHYDCLAVVWRLCILAALRLEGRHDDARAMARVWKLDPDPNQG